MPSPSRVATCHNIVCAPPHARPPATSCAAGTRSRPSSEERTFNSSGPADTRPRGTAPHVPKPVAAWGSSSKTAAYAPRPDDLLVPARGEVGAVASAGAAAGAGADAGKRGSAADVPAKRGDRVDRMRGSAVGDVGQPGLVTSPILHSP
jgi:hypothetical protein